MRRGSRVRSDDLSVDDRLTTEIAGIRMKNPVMVASGTFGFGKEYSDFLDLNQVLEAAGENWLQGSGGPARNRKILLAEASAFSRGRIRSGLDMAGYRVVEAASLEEAIRRLEGQSVDIVVAALDLPLDGTSALVAAMRRRPEWEAIPVLALADSAEQIRTSGDRATGFQDCQTKFDGAAMLESLARLAAAVDMAQAAPVAAGRALLS